MAIYGLQLHAFGQSTYYRIDEDVAIGDRVLVQEEDRLCLARVTSGPVDAVLHREDLPGILRVPTEADRLHDAENQRLTQEALRFCRECISARGLDMKLVAVEVFFDRSKIIFFFTAPTRIDFRELVKDLVRQYHTRIELRQIGVRHETQMVGAVGNCGMICCCRRYLRSFAPVTIRMAKEQNLFLNPSKISGSCGRLLCCLSYEQENYDNFFSKSPRVGKKYPSKKGMLKVVRTNLFRNSVSYVTETNEETEISLEDWLVLVPTTLEQSADVSDADLPSHDLYLDSSLPSETIDEYAYADPDYVQPEVQHKKAVSEPMAAESKKGKNKKKKKHKTKRH